MNTIQNNGLMQRWNTVQYELLPALQADHVALTPKLEQVIHALEWSRIEQFIPSVARWVGRPSLDRGMLANAFVAKAVLGISTTVGLIDRLSNDNSLKRICGFSLIKRLPDESTFSRAFAEFSLMGLAERCHEFLVKNMLGDRLIGHISRDGTAIHAREKPLKKVKLNKPSQTVRRGRPKQSEVREEKVSKVEQQLNKPLNILLKELPKECDRGTKCNAQGYKNSWNGYKLHIDTADCGIPVSAILTSASTHDSLASIPLALKTAERVTNCYDLMDAAYCSQTLREHSRSLGHVPLIDHNRRRGEKIAFTPSEAQRYKERSQAERTNGRLKDQFGANNIRVKGHVKVMSHLMFGILALTVDQIKRLLT
uniref:Transposase of ISCARN88, IS1182 family n=1 Tax=mine drainage metagenome TaxID=410659 RepID=E6QPZ9_9ZZZZ